MHDIPLNGHLMDDLPHDSTLYYVTGVVDVTSLSTNMFFKKNNTDIQYENTVLITISPVSYYTK